MNLDATIDELVQEAIQTVPDELREDLRGWIDRARSGAATEVSRQLLRDADLAWRAFDKAAQQVQNVVQG